MSLRLIKRGALPNWYVRGSIKGRKYFVSTQTTDSANAELVRREVERRALQRLPDHHLAWMPIPGYPGYEVTSTGRIRRAPSPDLAQQPSRYGYPTVRLSNGTGKQRYLSVHRAVALAFLGPAPGPHYQVCHKDGDKDNPSVENLYWGTAAENGRDKARHNAQHKQKRAMPKIRA